MSTPASAENSRLERLEGQVLGIAKSVPHMQEELERLRARTSELTRGLSSEREGRVNLSGFLELRGADGRLNVLVTELPVRVVGNERPELESIRGREKVNQSIAVWTGLVKGIEKDKTLLDMVITAGSPSEAWKILLGLVRESSDAA